jgi:hypothetical protein
MYIEYGSRLRHHEIPVVFFCSSQGYVINIPVRNFVPV